VHSPAFASELRPATLQPASGEVYLVGRRGSPHVPDYRDFLERNRVAFRWIDVDRNPLVRLLDGSRALQDAGLPFFLFQDGTTLEALPDRDEISGFARTRAALAARVGLHARPSEERYDLVILGAGPAGLTAAASAASEGLSTLVVERHAAGGQAGTSSRIENYPGFPQGISGTELAQASHEQALRLGAEIVIGSEMIESWPEGEDLMALALASGAVVRGRALIGATGSHYRRLDAEGVDELSGAGVYYGSSPSEAAFHRGGDVFIVGGANSAGQAALHAASYARSVTLVVRGGSLAARMSQYLVERCERHPAIAIQTHTKVVRALGDGRLERLVLQDVRSGSEDEVQADALFILIGGEPTSRCARGWLRRDEHGFVMTGPDVLVDAEREEWWHLERDPYLLEGSHPGVFFAGDVRHGSIKRVASAVGEGAMAVQLVHRFLASAA
jgi:thioredoxin reductase (NADPH)